MGPHLQLPLMPVAAEVDGQAQSTFSSGTMGQICEGCGVWIYTESSLKPRGSGRGGGKNIGCSQSLGKPHTPSCGRRFTKY